MMASASSSGRLCLGFDSSTQSLKATAIDENLNTVHTFVRSPPAAPWLRSILPAPSPYAISARAFPTLVLGPAVPCVRRRSTTKRT